MSWVLRSGNGEERRRVHGGHREGTASVAAAYERVGRVSGTAEKGWRRQVRYSSLDSSIHPLEQSIAAFVYISFTKTMLAGNNGIMV